MKKFLANILDRNRSSSDAPPTVKPEQTDKERPEDPTLALEVCKVTKKYGDFTALREVDLQVRKGDCLGIVGYNGAGKSTLLQLIAGTLKATSGTIRSRGRIVALLELGAGYNDEFTGLENIYMNAAILGVPRELINARLPEIEAFAEIGDFINKPVRTYSSGMRVRLAFSMLTQVDPDIMIIDEALSVGDAYFAHKCVRVIRRFREEGRTLLFVSHDPQAVKTLCDHAILLDRGLVVRRGTPIDILDYYNAMIAAREHDREIRQEELRTGRPTTRSGNRKAELERFELLDEQDRPVRAVLTGSVVSICCVVVFREPVENPTIGFLIRDRLGNNVFGTNTYHLKTKTGTFGVGERIEVCFHTTLNLGLGNYSVTLAAHAGPAHTDENYDWYDNLIAFSMIDNWPFHFVGVSALPVKVELAQTPRRLRRLCAWDQPVMFSDEGNARIYQISGWNTAEQEFTWTQGRSALLAFELPSNDRDAELVLDVIPYLAGNLSQQRLEIYLGGEFLNSWELSSPTSVTCLVPKRLIGREIQIELRCLDAVSPTELGAGVDTRQLGVAVRSLRWQTR